MPTKRTRKARNIRQRITPAAVEHYRTALALQDKYLKCVDGKIVCNLRTHCDDCAAYLNHFRALRTELGLKPWDPDPLTQDTELTKALEQELKQ